MRKRVISTGMGFSIPEEEQIAILSEIGWDGIFCGWGGRAHLERVANAAKKHNMLLQSVHAPFERAHLLWEAEEEGEQEADRLIACLRDSTYVGAPIVVMHAIIGMERHAPTSLGIKRFDRILNEADQCGIRVAVENTEGEEYLSAIFHSLSHHPSLGFCIDTGHEMCYNERRDLITKYGSYLIATHLNDNFGRTGNALTWLDDSHLLPFDGSADWQGIADRLKRVGYEGELTFELTSKNKPERKTHDRYAELDFYRFAAIALEKAKKLEELLHET